MNTTLETFRKENRADELREMIKSNFMASLATTTGERAEIATIFYVFDGNHLYFKSRTSSVHSINIEKINKVSISVYSHNSTYEAKYGFQLHGVVEKITDTITMEKVVGLYSNAFKGSGDKLPSIQELCAPEIKSTFYKLAIQEFKITDEDKSTNRTMLTYDAY